MKQVIIYSVISVFLLGSCTQERSEDLVKEPNKDGSIETQINVEHINNIDVLKTTHKVWVAGKLDKQIVNIDTLKSLGTALKIVEDEQKEEKQIVAPKEYEIYITVK